jgi:hypothetical protein
MQKTFEFWGSECASRAYVPASRLEDDLVRCRKAGVGKLDDEKSCQE